MSDSKRVYWKRREGSDATYISGMCLASDVPDYGYVSEESLPTELEITTDESGVTTIVSPPVLGTSYAYRYVLHLGPDHREKVKDETDYGIQTAMTLQKANAPDAGTTRGNWWWYAKGNFRYAHRDKTPVRLMKKWKGPMLEILLEGHPRKDELLADWAESIARHKAHVRRNAAPAAAKKTENELVVLPHPVAFNSNHDPPGLPLRAGREGRAACEIRPVRGWRPPQDGPWQGHEHRLRPGGGRRDRRADAARHRHPGLGRDPGGEPARDSLPRRAAFRGFADQARAEMEDWIAEARARPTSSRWRQQVRPPSRRSTISDHGRSARRPRRPPRRPGHASPRRWRRRGWRS